MTTLALIALASAFKHNNRKELVNANGGAVIRQAFA
jgi:hypothetical protein